MKIKNIDFQETIGKAKDILKSDENIAAETKTIFELLIELNLALFNRLGLNSSNSSKPPSTDELGENENKNSKKSKNPRGGQNGHKGTTLEPVENPDEIEEIKIDRRKLPRGKNYRSGDYIARQIVNIKISRIITEYRAEVLIDEQGNQYVAEFPEGLTRPIQYGASVKAHATYLSTYQLIPYDRIQEQFKNEYGIPLSAGSLYNFNAEASKLLVELGFDKAVIDRLKKAVVAHADETGINLDGKGIWLHNLSNESWTWFAPHKSRGTKAMNDIGILPNFKGVLCHDHWKPYYKYSCTHSLCNAHHLRELKRAFEQENQKWAEEMRIFLTNLNEEVDATGEGKLPEDKATCRKELYREILKAGDIECPAPGPLKNSKKRVKRSHSRNLLERLRDYEEDVLRFMVDSLVPFTNNFGEREIRMTKVQQKISGCFRSMEGAINFCRVRSFLSTCKKNGVSATDALNLLFGRKLPAFLEGRSNSS